MSNKLYGFSAILKLDLSKLGKLANVTLRDSGCLGIAFRDIYGLTLKTV